MREKSINGNSVALFFAPCFLPFAAAEAQQTKKSHGFGFSAAPPPAHFFCFSRRIPVFRDLGYIQGKNILIE